jgi:hypothetical protein
MLGEPAEAFLAQPDLAAAAPTSRLSVKARSRDFTPQVYRCETAADL